jgi:hypothetical protein
LQSSDRVLLRVWENKQESTFSMGMWWKIGSGMWAGQLKSSTYNSRAVFYLPEISSFFCPSLASKEISNTTKGIGKTIHVRIPSLSFLNECF